jgi:hypothetical protein
VCLTDMASCDRAIAGVTRKQPAVIVVRVAISNGLLPRYAIA